MSIKVTRDFDLNKLRKSEWLVKWLNQYGNEVVRSIENSLKTSTDVNGSRFKSGGDFTHDSVQDGKAHKRPLVRSGRLANSVRKLPATAGKLTFIVSSFVKSKARWNVKVDKTYSSGTRKVKGVNYGAMLNEGFKTSDDSLIPGKNVKQRKWFGVSRDLLVGGSKYKVLVRKLGHFYRLFSKTPMREYK